MESSTVRAWSIVDFLPARRRYRGGDLFASKDSPAGCSNTLRVIAETAVRTLMPSIWRRSKRFEPQFDSEVKLNFSTLSAGIAIDIKLPVAIGSPLPTT